VKETVAAGDSSKRFPIPVAVIEAIESTARPERKPPRASNGGGRHPLPRLLSKWHVASRKDAEALVRSGRVTVNGTVVRDVARMVDPRKDRLALDGRSVAAPDAGSFAYVLLNKPRGVVTTTKDPEGRSTVMDLVPGGAPGLAPVGRLDKDSAGLLLLTNDHELGARLLDPVNHVGKTYRVKVKGHVTAETVARMTSEPVVSDGLSLEPFPGIAVESVGPRSTWLRITLEEGKNRQIRRQCEAFGHEVELIVRMTFGPLDLGALKPGASRTLTSAEVAALRRA
jgi:23S rRNA pseudouridine2605 synthase